MKTALIIVLTAFLSAISLRPAAAQTEAERDRCGNICGQAGMTCLLGVLSDPGPGARADYVRECRACVSSICGGGPAAPPTKAQPEAPAVICPGDTDKASVGINWSPGKEIRDYTVKVGTAPGGDDISIIGPLKGVTSTGVDSIPPGKTIHVTLISYSNEGTEMPRSSCSFTSIGEASILFMRLSRDTMLSGAFLRVAPARTAEACSAACKDDPACRAFTFNNTATPQSHQEYCELKSMPGAARASSCCVSGIKELRPAGTAATAPPPRSISRPPVSRAPDIAGRWSFENDGAVRTFVIEQAGDSITFIDSANRRVQGRIDRGKVVVEAWSLEGSILNGGAQIYWSSGHLWSRQGSQQTIEVPPNPQTAVPPIVPNGAWIATDDSEVIFTPGPGGTWNVFYRKANGTTGSMSLRWAGRSFHGSYQTFDQSGAVTGRGTQEFVIAPGGLLVGPWETADGRSGLWTLRRK